MVQNLALIQLSMNLTQKSNMFQAKSKHISNERDINNYQKNERDIENYLNMAR